MIKKILKITSIFFSFSLIAVVGYVSGNVTKYYLDVRKADNVVNRFQGSLEEPYKNDTYGGKTPEETWVMFLDALKKEDVDLAIKYYSVGSMDVPRDQLYIEKQNGQLQEWVKELETIEKDDQQSLSKDRSYYFFNYYNEKYKETLSSPVVFYLNPYTKVWKIVSL